jgi:non-ribosomal peptide synthase protein (TIGR01720 family)
VLLRWEDWLAGADLTTTRALPAAVLVLERALFDLCQAVSVFRARSDAALLIGVCPASPRWSEPPWAGVLSGLTDRLHRFCVRHHKDVQVIPMDPWAQRYGVAEPCGDLAAHQEPLRYTAELDAAVATVVARRAHRGRHPALASVVLDPGRFPATTALTRFVRDQVRFGRDVTLTSEPTSPELASLVTSGPVRVAAAGDAVSQLGELVASGVIEPETTLALDPDPAVGAALRASWPRIHAVTVPSGEAPDDFAGHLWVLDRPVTGAPDDPAAEIPHDLLADIATELNTADRIWSAVQAGYRRPAQRESAVPRTEREQILAAIWADVLQLDEVGVHDDFYGLGGDSLLTIMAAFRAGEAGIELTARQITQHRTIAALAAAVGRQTHDAEPQIADDGDMPLTPAQLWWCETVAPTMARPALFNHPYYLELRRPVSAGHLADAIGLLAAHHDALRLRFRRDAAGIWRQYHALPADAVPFASHDLSGLPAGEQDEAMLSLATAEQLGLDIANGPTCRVVHFRLGPDRPDRLLIVAHHLVVDAVSRELLLSDLQTLCGQLGRAEVPRLPAKTTSYRTWAVRLTDQATIERVRAELPFWLDQRAEDGDTLPPDHPGGVTTLGSTSSVDATLSVQATVALHDVARRMRVSVRDLLVWGVAQAVTARTGRSECAIATTGHGREDLFDDVDVSRTVGWFQVLYPLRLRLGAGDGGAGSVAEVAEQLARVPNNGIGYGQLRFGCPDPDVRQRLAQVPAPRIAVNYMGGFGFDDAVQTAELFEVCAAPYGPTEDGSGAWPFDLDVVGTLVGGRLRIEVGYGTAVYRRESAEGLLTDLHSRLVNLASVTGRRSAMTP